MAAFRNTLADLEARLDSLHASLDEAKITLETNKKRSKECASYSGTQRSTSVSSFHNQLCAIKWKSKREQFKAEH